MSALKIQPDGSLSSCTWCLSLNAEASPLNVWQPHTQIPLCRRPSADGTPRLPVLSFVLYLLEVRLMYVYLKYIT